MPLKPINTQKKITKKSIKVEHIDFKKNSISGDFIKGGTIEEFSSTGIKDLAKQATIEITDKQTSILTDVFIRGKINCQTLQYNRAEVPKINATEAVMIDNNEVLWKDRLGKSVRISSLNKVGTLDDLEVKDLVYAKQGRVGINTMSPSDVFSVKADGIETKIGAESGTSVIGTHFSNPLSLVTDNTPRLTVETNGNIRVMMDLSIAGNLGVGIHNPTQKLEVEGNIKFADRIFSGNISAPTTGSWTKGSIVWNDNPDIGLPIGWVCVKGGQPGAWRPFGHIQ